MNTLRLFICGLAVVALVGAPIGFADEHPGEHPGTEATPGAANPTGTPDMGATPSEPTTMAPTKAGTKTKGAKRAGKRQMKMKKTTEAAPTDTTTEK